MAILKFVAQRRILDELTARALCAISTAAPEASFVRIAKVEHQVVTGGARYRPTRDPGIVSDAFPFAADVFVTSSTHLWQSYQI
jgi:hypothetical protein